MSSRSTNEIQETERWLLHHISQKQIDEYDVKVLLSAVESEPLVPEGQAKYGFGAPTWELRSSEPPPPPSKIQVFFIFVCNIFSE